MEKLLFPFFILASLAFFCPKSAEKAAAPTVSRLDEKMAPDDHFIQQRSWPLREFPLAGYLRAIETALFQQKNEAESLGPCDSKPRWRLEGPSNVAGRVNVLAKHPTDDQTILAGFASGGIWRTTNGGQTWAAVFDQFPHLAIGDLTWSQTDFKTVWAATGDPNVTSYPAPGNGVFKSSDGGQTWAPAGLQGFGTVARILPNPLNINELWAAVMGNPFKRDSKRGVFRSLDGGQTWTQKLAISTQAGAVDLAIDPLQPATIYATGWDRIRSNKESVIFGPGCKIFKTTDAGATWAALGGGLPTELTGRIGIAMSATNPQKLYAVMCDTFSKFKGIFKTINAGATWTAMPGQAALTNAYSDFGWYFGKVKVTPTNDDEVWVLGLQANRSSGQTFVQHASTHNDVHDLLFLANGEWIVGTDGGPYRSAPWMIGPVPGGPLESARMNSLPTTQFYRAAFDPFSAGRIRGGAQDNGTVQGIFSSSGAWTTVAGADGFQPIFHPTDSKKQYVEMQNGVILASSDGVNFQSGSTALGTTDRVNWDMPYLLNVGAAKHWAGTYRLYESSGLGPQLAWSAISLDLTKGNVFGPRFHTITTIDDSKLLPGKLIIGTSDGNVWRRETTNFWAKVTGNGLPDRYVTALKWSPTSITRVYAALSGYRDDEQLAHLFRSDNDGNTWLNASGDLPPVAINELLIVPNSMDQKLVVATDAGVYFSKNGGDNWQLAGAGMPQVPVYDLDFDAVQKRILAATFGRSAFSMHVDTMFSQPSATITVAGKILPLVGASQSVVPLNVAIGGTTASFLGDFSIKIGQCAPIELTPTKNDNPTEGVSAFDLVLIAKHILGSETFDKPEKWIAADVNRSGAVSTLDIVDLRKMILGIAQVFPNGNPSWRFFEKNHVFPAPNPLGAPLGETIALDPAFLPAPAPLVEFRSVKIGDVNNSTAGFAGEAQSRSRWPVFVENRWFEKGETVEMELSADLFEKAGWQFSLGFEVEKLRLLAAEPLLDALFLNEKKAEKGQLAALWTNPKSLALGLQKMLRLRFLALESGRFSEAVWLADAPTAGAAFSTQGIDNQPIMQFIPSKFETKKAVAAIAAPNPAGDFGTVIFAPKWAEKAASAELFDGSGRLVFSASKIWFDGDGSWPLPAERFPSNGFFVLRLRSGEETAQVKILKK